MLSPKKNVQPSIKKTIDDHTLICRALREKDFDTYLRIISEHTNYEAHMKES